MTQLHFSDALRRDPVLTLSKSDPAARQGHPASTARPTHQDHRCIRAKACSLVAAHGELVAR